VPRNPVPEPTKRELAQAAVKRNNGFVAVFVAMFAGYAAAGLSPLAAVIFAAAAVYLVK